MAEINNVFDEGHVSVKQFISMAHAIQDALVMLDVTAHSPIQGEAMHKVIAYHALKALELSGIDSEGQSMFTIREDL